MKGSCTLVASVLAASTVAFSSSGDAVHALNPTSVDGLSCDSRKGGDSSSHMSISSGKEKFVPRFDGLRFIETLVTAHR